MPVGLHDHLAQNAVTPVDDCFARHGDLLIGADDQPGPLKRNVLAQNAGDCSAPHSRDDHSLRLPMERIQPILSADAHPFHQPVRGEQNPRLVAGVRAGVTDDDPLAPPGRQERQGKLAVVRANVGSQGTAENFITNAGQTLVQQRKRADGKISQESP